ncbi:hypothetical protein A1O3_06579 [Capronia epimyces CBS 606.96]|uniref:Uncharacterized protein n=1 Tax=Capronia epimyces CBS 606.96 TaxID=1182542 RepID=W9YKH4_9EURO|nr:uncharacterized protein A1O3_06579 [Capronia epimyces CBS 606.96]EXJ82764.1 hypothetical protein A1O3_06579 [Capronia epimyces CBS 606.96]
MGKLNTAHPPTREVSTSFPRMEPPPPYEASVRSSSSANSNDRLYPQGDSQAQSRSQSQPQPQVQQLQIEQQSPTGQSDPDNKRKTEDGCCTFGDGATGCMVYGDHSEGCLVYGDNANGCSSPTLAIVAIDKLSGPTRISITSPVKDVAFGERQAAGKLRF